MSLSGHRRWRSGLISFYVATLAPFWFSNMVVFLVVSWIATIFAMDGSLKNAAGAKEQAEAERISTASLVLRTSAASENRGADPGISL
jgi:hypothetical protein